MSKRWNGEDGKYLQDHTGAGNRVCVCDGTERSAKCIFFVKNKGSCKEFSLNE